MPRKRFGTAVCVQLDGSIVYVLYVVSLSADLADPTHFRGTHCRLILVNQFIICEAIGGRGGVRVKIPLLMVEGKNSCTGFFTQIS